MFRRSKHRHVWGAWSPMRRKEGYANYYQYRACIDQNCNKIEERML